MEICPIDGKGCLYWHPRHCPLAYTLTREQLEKCLRWQEQKLMIKTGIYHQRHKLYKHPDRGDPYVRKPSNR